MPIAVSRVRRTAKRWFRWCVVNGRLDENRVRAVMGHILQSRRRGYLVLVSEFKRLLKLEYAGRTARVDAAFPLPTDLQARVRNVLNDVYGQAIQTEFADDPDLIAGIRIRIGNDVYDGSVRATLAALAGTFGIPSA
ncbi:MAG TPA: F0F1 ATP synthase subunit delta [Dongiaceae bacterium]|nr:F0F1 ATP synthase subunit delta [Dongiaceae bacterium]